MSAIFIQYTESNPQATQWTHIWYDDSFYYVLLLGIYYILAAHGFVLAHTNILFALTDHQEKGKEYLFPIVLVVATAGGSIPRGFHNKHHHAVVLWCSTSMFSFGFWGMPVIAAKSNGIHLVTYSNMRTTGTSTGTVVRYLP